MTQRIPIPKIFAMYIDKNMETRGYTTRIHQSNNIEVQEVSRSLKENNLMPFAIRVHNDKNEIFTFS
ncbi:hypothetical protein M9Y10_001378 [Tritrichomonas musculus]|uniref:Uncharacterized protein n=1 Tax=Tritrichomonas musculus TaxID=1915356 RepID=A0ABR2L6U8_9EUKA